MTQRPVTARLIFSLENPLVPKEEEGIRASSLAHCFRYRTGEKCDEAVMLEFEPWLGK